MSDVSAASALAGNVVADVSCAKELAERIALNDNYKKGHYSRREVPTNGLITYIENQVKMFPESCIKSMYDNFDKIVAGIEANYNLGDFLFSAKKLGMLNFEPYVYSGSSVPVLFWDAMAYITLFGGETFELHQSLNWEQRLHSAYFRTFEIKEAFSQALPKSESNKRDTKHWENDSKAFGILMYMNLITTFGVYEGFSDLLTQHQDVLDKFMKDTISCECGTPVTFNDVCSYDKGAGVSMKKNCCPIKIVSSNGDSYARVYLTMEHKFYIEVMEGGSVKAYEFDIPSIEDGLTDEQALRITDDEKFLNEYYHSSAVNTIAITAALTRLGCYSDADEFYASNDMVQLPNLEETHHVVNGGIKHLMKVIEEYYG